MKFPKGFKVGTTVWVETNAMDFDGYTESVDFFGKILIRQGDTKVVMAVYAPKLAGKKFDRYGKVFIQPEDAPYTSVTYDMNEVAPKDNSYEWTTKSGNVYWKRKLIAGPDWVPDGIVGTKFIKVMKGKRMKIDLGGCSNDLVNSLDPEYNYNTF